jgi:hypothetical protein
MTSQVRENMEVFEEEIPKLPLMTSQVRENMEVFEEEIPMKTRAVLTIAVILAGILTLGVVLQVQAQADNTQRPQPPTLRSAFHQSQLESFASVALKIKEIRSGWQSQMQGADSAEKVKELQEKASSEMVSAVKERGLTMETYNAIATAARDNPGLAAHIDKLMEQPR